MTGRLLILLCCVMVSCHSPRRTVSSRQTVYMQDAVGAAAADSMEGYLKRVAKGEFADSVAEDRVGVNRGLRIQPRDVLSIVVSSQTPELATTLNLPLLSYQAGSSSESSSYSQRLLGYQVSTNGTINFPTLGKLPVAGLTREQLSDYIKLRLIEGGQLMDPIVTVDIMNLRISVLGEVMRPGTFSLSDDRITIFEAIGQAGDLTVYGRRDNVLVMREQDGMIHYHRLDLRARTVTASPAFYLQQNDVVYVEPNKTATARAQINENKSLGMIISFGSLLISLAVVIFK